MIFAPARLRGIMRNCNEEPKFGLLKFRLLDAALGIGPGLPGERTVMDIADWRRKIDEIDRRLVRSLNERAQCVLEIGRIKRQSGLPILESNREQEVIRHALDANRGPLENKAIGRVFEAIMREGRALQQELFDKEDSQAGKKP